MAELLEVAHLPQQHGMPEMEVGGRGVEAGLDHQRLAGGPGALELRAELSLVDQLDRAPPEQGELVVDRGEVAAHQAHVVEARLEGAVAVARRSTGRSQWSRSQAENTAPNISRRAERRPGAPASAP
jgi:hypothetical protein